VAAAAPAFGQTMVFAVVVERVDLLLLGVALDLVLHHHYSGVVVVDDVVAAADLGKLHHP
jgi:hypothetical protein